MTHDIEAGPPTDADYSAVAERYAENVIKREQELRKRRAQLFWKGFWSVWQQPWVLVLFSMLLVVTLWSMWWHW